jgi:hypothetical protein
MNQNRPQRCLECGANNDGTRPLAHLQRGCDTERAKQTEPEWVRRARENRLAAWVR